MRKLWLTFTAMLFCSIASFAQTQLTQGNFVSAIKANPSGSFILTEDINLGTYSESNNFIIESFSGVLDGNNHTITYQASFTATDNAKLGLFRTVSGKITNLNLAADITVGGSGANVKVGLLCGEFQHNTNAETVIEFCDVTGNINSTVKAGTIGHASTGLIIGSNLDTLRYCTGHGNVTGVGYVGGLVGSMGTVAEDNNYGEWRQGKLYKPLIRGCYFTGNVTANNSSTGAAQLLEGLFEFFGGEIKLQSFAGGICGTMRKPAKIELCVAEAIIVVGQNAGGITNTTLGGNDCDVNNNYCTGSVNGASITNNNIVSTIRGNPTDNNNPNYCGNTGLQTIVNNLNTKRGSDNNFYFDVINGKVVLIVRTPETEVICETPTGVTIVKSGSNYKAEWNITSSVTDKEFIYTLSGGALNTEQTGTVEGVLFKDLGVLSSSPNPYVFKVKQDCESSNEVSYTFYVNSSCTPVSALLASNITTTSATITWIGTADAIKVNNDTQTLHGTQGTLALTGLQPNTTYTVDAIVSCTQNGNTTDLKTTISFTTLNSEFVTARTGNFNIGSTWVGGKAPQGDIANITINTGHEVTVTHNLVITEDYKIVTNDGVLVIPQSSGQLINMTEDNVPGIVEIVSAQKATQEWTFIGAPFKDGYLLGCILPESHDVSVKKYDYTEGRWSDSWAHIGTPMNAGEGYFAYPFYGGVVTFTTYGDVGTYEDRGIGYTSTDTETELNINNVEVSLPSNCPNNWMALSNPYPAKLKVSKFLTDNGSKLQGNCVYVFKDGSFDQGNINTGDIAMTEGFFVNFAANAVDKTITFKKEQLSYNNPTSAKASANEFIKLTLINGNKKVRAYLAHNEDAEQGYDIFDANKLFAPTEIAEPYFVTDGIELMKEEFAELPYYATMNVRSFADDTVSFVVNNIPEGLAVSIIDGENIIDMVEGGVYTTEILTGENADRFKVLIKKNVGIADVEELEVNITNNNRHINIETTETDLQVEVYNALGQKVLSTKDRNFTLNQVSAGAYLIKAFNNKASKTQKIVVE